MQNISIEFRKGILFIRLKRRIDNEIIENIINYLIDYIGIKIIVLNISDINYFSHTDIEHIINYKTNLLKKKTKLIICDGKTKGNYFFNKIPKINKEIDAFSLI